MTNINRYLAAIFSSLLAGCGGGGGSITPQAIPSFSYQDAVNVLHANGASVNVSATQTGSTTCTGSGNITISPVSTGTVFYLTPIRPVNAVSATTTISWNWTNCTPAHNALSETDFFSVDRFQSLGYTTGNIYAAFLSSPSYPAMVTVGQNGGIGTINLFSDSTESTAVGYSTLSYSVSAEKNGDGALITITSQTYNSAGTLQGIVSTVEQINATGGLTIVSKTLSFPLIGTVVTLTAS